MKLRAGAHHCLNPQVGSCVAQEAAGKTQPLVQLAHAFGELEVRHLERAFPSYGKLCPSHSCTNSSAVKGSSLRRCRAGSAAFSSSISRSGVSR
jgi:hypothetical protein